MKIDKDKLITFPKSYILVDGLVETSDKKDLKPQTAVSAILPFESLVRLFEACLDDVLQLELYSRITKPLEQFNAKEALEKVRIDDRLEFIMALLINAGASEKTLLQIMWHRTRENEEEYKELIKLFDEIQLEAGSEDSETLEGMECEDSGEEDGEEDEE